MNIRMFEKNFLEFEKEYNQFSEGVREYRYNNTGYDERNESIEKHCRLLCEELFVLSENDAIYRMLLQNIIREIKPSDNLSKVLFLIRCLEKKWISDFDAEIGKILSFLIEYFFTAYIDCAGTFEIEYVEYIIDIILFKNRTPQPVLIPVLRKIAKIYDIGLCWYANKSIDLLLEIDTPEAIDAIKDFLLSPNFSIAEYAKKTLESLSQE